MGVAQLKIVKPVVQRYCSKIVLLWQRLLRKLKEPARKTQNWCNHLLLMKMLGPVNLKESLNTCFWSGKSNFPVFFNIDKVILKIIKRVYNGFIYSRELPNMPEPVSFFKVEIFTVHWRNVFYELRVMNIKQVPLTRQMKI